MDLTAMAGQARHQLTEVVLPFWLSYGIDTENGGFHTTFDNRGRRQGGAGKFVWSQGRFVWLLARAADLSRRGVLDLEPEQLLVPARAGAQFLRDHAVHPDGTCSFVLTDEGRPWQGSGQSGHSVYADCFFVMGLAELARADRDQHWLQLARPVLATARRSVLAGTADTPPYEVPAGYRAFGPPMILLNTMLVVGQAQTELEGGLDPELRAQLAELVDVVTSHRLADGTVQEMIGPAEDTLVARHRVPGHAIEGMWVLLETLDLIGDDRDRTPLLETIVASCELGWDREYGGLLRYTDASGPLAPQGVDTGTGYEGLVKRTWSTKLWWVHSETFAAAAIAAYGYRYTPAAPWVERVWAYTMDVFPGGDEGAEWIQIRDRSGAPLDEVVALPVKDPFHISRNLMQIIELTHRRS